MARDEFFRCMAKCGQARAGVINLGNIEVPTPYFMPIATRGIPKDATFEDIRSLGFSLLLMNTYHLICRPGLEVISQLGGLKRFTGWDLAILTDSGGFQIFSLSPLREISPEGVRFRDYESGAEFFLSPESCIDAQISFASEIIMALDICSALPADRKELEKNLIITHEWAQRAHDHFHNLQDSGLAKGTHLFGIVQGGTEEDLRQKSLEFISSLNFSGHAVGGLSVGESREDYQRIAVFCASNLPEAKPRYLMGVGSPSDLVEAVSWGYDLFDCVLPTRMARHGVAYSFDGFIHLRQEKWKLDASRLVENCPCRVCQNYSKAFIRHLFTADEVSAAILLTYHNLFFYKSLMDTLRNLIISGELSKKVDEMRAKLSRKL